MGNTAIKGITKIDDTVDLAKGVSRTPGSAGAFKSVSNTAASAGEIFRRNRSGFYKGAIFDPKTKAFLREGRGGPLKVLGTGDDVGDTARALSKSEDAAAAASSAAKTKSVAVKTAETAAEAAGTAAKAKQPMSNMTKAMMAGGGLYFLSMLMPKNQSKGGSQGDAPADTPENAPPKSGDPVATVSKSFTDFTNSFGEDLQPVVMGVIVIALFLIFMK